MKRIILSLLFLLMTSVALMAQGKMLNLADVFRDPSLYPVRMNQLQWRGSTNSFTFVENDTMKLQQAGKGKAGKLLTLDELNAAVTSAGFKAFKRFPACEWDNENVLLITAGASLYSYDVPGNKATLISKLPEEAENVEYAENTHWAAYTLGETLYVQGIGEQVEVGKPESEGIVYGKTVSRNEFGISDGIFWSPDGKLLAFYRKDESRVTNYPLVDIEPRVAELSNVRYPMAGMSTETIRVGVYNPATGKTLFLQTGDEPEEYLTNITWSPDASMIFVAELNREQNHMHLNVYDASTGVCIKTLFEEKNERYMEPLQGPIFDPALPADQFIWHSYRDGYMHLYLYNMEGKMIKQLTKGPWVVSDFLGFNAKATECYIIATKDSPLERHLYKVDVRKGGIQKITQAHGTHALMLSTDKSYALDKYSSTDIASEYLLTSTLTSNSEVIKENIDPLIDYNLGEMSIITLKAEDGTDLFCSLIKPINFDPDIKYPVIVYVYGGPHVQMVTDSWTGGTGYYLNYLAQKGYVIFTLDNRGSANRGFEFESVIHRRLGEIEMRDQMVGVEYLRNLPWVDTGRIGIHGWSYGGFMTINMMLTYPDVFKVGVAGGPVIDWKYYEVMYGERYMDMPAENPQGYEANNLSNKSGDLEGKLLIIHGTIDETVVMQHSLKFIKSCIDNQKQVDFFVYPGHEHNVRGKDRLHLWDKTFIYFEDFL